MPEPLPRHQRPTRLPFFLFGAPYYPEHWTPADREHDPERMAAAGMNVVRMAEFAWDRLEPRPGEFDFSLFDETSGRLGRAGVRTILCTPTATPPRWLTLRHPDWMRVDENGRRMDHGTRQHACTNNESFRAESRRITQAMAEHYRDNPYVIGWQTDNELYCHFSLCYCPACQAGFQAWLRTRYATVAALNQAWGNAFWALTYDDFDQIPLPYISSRPAYPNPSHELDYYRYLGDSVAAFQREQVEILRSVQPTWWITHNGLFGHIDYFRFTDDLDFLGVDVYPGFVTRNPDEAVATALWNERCRAVTGGYIVPEQQSGPGGQKPYVHATPQPGQMRLWAYQSVAHGADGILHFRWRTCRFGAETYWHGILDHDNVPRRRYAEFAQEGAEFRRLGPDLLGTVLEVKAGVLSQTDQTDAHATLHLGLPSPDQQRDLAYTQLWRRHLPCGLVDAADSFAGLDLLVLPSLPLMDADLADRLQAFVTAGGTLLVTARSALRSRQNQAWPTPLPGLLSAWCGCQVAEYGKTDAAAPRLQAGPVTIPPGAVYEILEPTTDAEVLARWTPTADGAPHAADGQPALTSRRLGNGRILYLGTHLSAGNAAGLMGLVLGLAPIPPLAVCDETVEVTCRHGHGRRLLFVLNHSPRPQTVTDLPHGRELVADRACPGRLDLLPYGVAVVQA